MKCVNICKVPRTVLKTQAINAVIILVVMVVGVSFIVITPHYAMMSTGQDLPGTEKPNYFCKAMRCISDS